jgi:uncharacterized protein (DUF488 family)
MKLVEYTLPQFWAVALMNDDTSHFEGDDQECFDRFVAYMLDEHRSCRCVDVKDDGEFLTWHDARDFGVLACDVATFVFDVTRHTEHNQ